jgi:uncharacterized protein YjgD (DUF1641 family)
MEEYIKEKMKEFASNIDDFLIDENIIDSDGKISKITNKTINSIEVYTNKKSKEGVSGTNWYTMANFNRRFKKQCK